MIIRQKKSRYDKGGVSIFIVVFTALLVTIVTASFVQIVVRNQQSATYNDLSQSAYDAAMAGVEDAKRALVRLRNCQNGDDATCNVAELRNKLESGRCDTLGDVGVVTFDPATHEVQVGDEKLNQAYTCVKMVLDTDTVEGVLETSDVKTVPLRGKDGFDRVKISWFSQEDLARGASASVPFVPLTSPPLPQKTTTVGWEETRPPVLRTQFIQFKKTAIRLSDFTDKGTNNTRTAFLYPNTIGNPEYNLNSIDARRSPESARNEPKSVQCDVSNIQTGINDGYVCSVILELPNPEGGNKSNREAYLQLQPIYNKAHYRIQLFDGSSPVLFDAVQPQVDSTGRASDLFRRVRASIALTDGGPDLYMPDASLSVKGNVCKDFFITNDARDFVPGSCQP